MRSIFNWGGGNPESLCHCEKPVIRRRSNLRLAGIKTPTQTPKPHGDFLNYFILIKKKNRQLKEFFVQFKPYTIAHFYNYVKRAVSH